MMSVFVAEISGKVIAALNASSTIEAEEVLLGEDFEEELLVLEIDGRPIWDGNTDIHIRKALPEEEAKWEASRARAVLANEIVDDEDEQWLALLVPVADPTHHQG
jgi:hypothetical protein